MQKYKKSDLVDGRTRAKILRRNIKRSNSTIIGGIQTDLGNSNGLTSILRSYKKIRTATSGDTDPKFAVNNINRISEVMLNEMGCSIVNIPTSYSLLQDQTDKEPLTNPNIQDPQLSIAKAEKISPTIQYGEGDPFYVHDDQISRYKSYSSPVPSVVRTPTLAELSSLVTGMSTSRSRSSSKYI
mgnify:FL=1|tara:strand:- start:289 stop:840 length:552 start_codon:yes stop_codon:yes gene_type:complete